MAIKKLSNTTGFKPPEVTKSGPKTDVPAPSKKPRGTMRYWLEEVARGTQFGMWRTTGVVSREKGKIRVECRCECGRIKNVAGYTLIKEISTACQSCGVSKPLPNIPIGTQFGSWATMSLPFRDEDGSLAVVTQCKCGAINKTQRLRSLTSGVSLGCRSCAKKKNTPLDLRYRLGGARQRCQDPNYQAFHNYGARGIEFRFANVEAAAQWVVENLGLPTNYRELDLDRIDNDGHYEPGNLRWATRSQNLRNRRSSKRQES